MFGEQYVGENFSKHRHRSSLEAVEGEPHESDADRHDATTSNISPSRRSSSPHGCSKKRRVKDLIREQDEEAGHILEQRVPRAKSGSPEKRSFMPHRSHRAENEVNDTTSSSSSSTCSSSTHSRTSSGQLDGAADTAGMGTLLPLHSGQRTSVGQRRPWCSLLSAIPVIAILLLLVLFLWIATTSGQSKVEETSPRAVLIIVEGFSGDAFNSMMEDGVHLPNIRRLMAGRGGVWAACPTITDSRCARAVSVEEQVLVVSRNHMDTDGNYIQGSPVDNTDGGDQQRQERFNVYSATSIASILSGVHPSRHEVMNNSITSMFRYEETSKKYPSLAKIIKNAGMEVTVLGTSHLLNSLGNTYSCTEPGVLDMECPDSVSTPAEGVKVGGTEITTLECMASSSCNTNVRRIKLPTNIREMNNGIPDEQYRRTLRDIFGPSTMEQQSAASTAFNNGNSTAPSTSQLYIFHFDALARRSESPYLPRFSYDLNSTEYLAQAYIIDALIGQILAYVQDRSERDMENWLIMGVSDHGGNGKSVNFEEGTDVNTTASSTPNNNGVSGVGVSVSTGKTIPTGFDDTQLTHLLKASVVPFFMGTYTTNTKKNYVTLKPLERPTSQLDVLPTILRWLNVAPFDDATEAAWVAQATAGSTASSTATDSALTEHLEWRKAYDGAVQGICSSGVLPLDCVR